jgi:arylsulfatase A-like enzyme
MTLRDRPNVVIFMPDQLRFDAASNASTPNLDALRARGTTVTNAFSQHSVCSPSRVSMLTGWYPHVAGHRTLTNLLKPWEPNLLALVQQAGYFVAWAGHRGDAMAAGVTESSTDFSGFLVKPEVLAEEPYHASAAMIDAYHFGARPGPTLDFDEATVRTAVQLLADGMPEPWLLFVPLVFPHPPFTVEEPWYSLHSRADVPAPVGHGTGKAELLGALRRAYGTDRLSPDDWAELVATYYGMVSRVDDQLGHVLASVDHDRTATLFFTDHGEYLGDYGAVEKWPAGVDDCLVHNPLVIAAPGGREGQTASALVEMVDLLPTLLELAGTEPAHTQFGLSLTHLLDDGARSHREAAFTEGGFALRERDRMERVPFGHYAAKVQLQIDRPDLVGRCTAMRTDRWTYVYRLDGADELYDRRDDPRELVNLARSTLHAGTVRRMRDQTLRWLVDTSDVIPADEDPRFPRIPQGYRNR